MRHMIHKVICWYLRCCGGAFHCYNYGPSGRYVAVMTEAEYAHHNKGKNETHQPHQIARPD